MNPQEQNNNTNPSGGYPPQQPNQQFAQPAQNPYLPQQQPIQPMSQQPAYQQPYMPETNPGKSNKTRMMAGAAILLLILSIAGSTLIFSNKNKSNDGTTSSEVTGSGASPTQSVKAEKTIPDSKSYDTTSANIDTECFSYKVIEGTKTGIDSCSSQSFYYNSDYTSNGEFRVDYVIGADFGNTLKLTDDVIKKYSSSIVNNEVAKKTITSSKKTKVNGLPAYELIAKQNDDNFIWKFIIIETGNKFAIDNEVRPFFEISGEYDNSDGNTATFFDNALASFKWK